MRYFSGFSLQNEQELFDFWLPNTQYSVVGFSYGAIKALNYTLNSNKRIDRLVLLSPAYFNDKDEVFKKAQLLYFKKDPKKYIENFLKNVTYKSSIDLNRYLKSATANELKELLYFKWNREDLKKISSNGTIIEVILGENDKIINSKKALEFFKGVATTYYIKNANHILKEIENGY